MKRWQVGLCLAVGICAGIAIAGGYEAYIAIIQLWTSRGF